VNSKLRFGLVGSCGSIGNLFPVGIPYLIESIDALEHKQEAIQHLRIVLVISDKNPFLRL
jgi:hypothetical protein